MSFAFPTRSLLCTTRRSVSVIVRCSHFARSFSQSSFTHTVPSTEKTPRIVIYASHVSTVTGDNPFSSIADTFDLVWQKSFPESFATSRAIAEEEKGEPIMTPEEQMNEDLKSLGLAPEFQTAMETATKADGTTRAISQAKKIFETKLDALNVDSKTKDKLKRFTRSQINKTFGSNNEASFIKDFEFKTNIKVKENNQKFFKMDMGVTNLSKFPWALGGRIDGFHDGRLIEIKNRVSRIMDPIPEYEIVQFQCYLHLLGLPRGDLLQRMKADSSTMGEKTTSIQRDEQKFHQEIVPPLQLFCDFLDYFLSNPRFAVEYLIKARKDQEMFLKHHLQAKNSTQQRVVYDPDVIAR